MLGKNEKFGVVIAVSKAYDSATSFVYAREVDGNEFGGFGKPFQLSRRSNDFSKQEWDNDILTVEKIGLGTILKYEQLGEEYLYTENTKFRPQVSTGIDTIALFLYIPKVTPHTKIFFFQIILYDFLKISLDFL